MPLPGFLKVVFWDLKFDALCIRENQDLIIARVVEYGTDEAVRWLRQTYDDAAIARAMEDRKEQLSSRTLGLWRIWLNKAEDWCAKNPSRPLKGVFWRS